MFSNTQQRFSFLFALIFCSVAFPHQKVRAERRRGVTSSKKQSYSKWRYATGGLLGTMVIGGLGYVLIKPYWDKKGATQPDVFRKEKDTSKTKDIDMLEKTPPPSTNTVVLKKGTQVINEKYVVSNTKEGAYYSVVLYLAFLLYGNTFYDDQTQIDIKLAFNTEEAKKVVGVKE